MIGLTKFVIECFALMLGIYFFLTGLFRVFEVTSERRNKDE